MVEINAAKARNDLEQLIDKVAASHQAIILMGERNKAVLVSEEDWSAIQQTLFLLSVPDMQMSIREGMAAPMIECDETLNW